MQLIQKKIVFEPTDDCDHFCCLCVYFQVLSAVTMYTIFNEKKNDFHK